MPGRRFGRRRGRFFGVRDEQRRINRGLELYQSEYGTEVEWWFLHVEDTVIDDTYDEGDILGGKAFDGPHRMPVLAALTRQGQEMADDQGFAVFDHVTLKLSYEQARRAGLSLNLINRREEHLHDRFVWRDRVYDVEAIQTSGHFDQTSRDMTILVQATQLRDDELIDSPEFQKYYAYHDDPRDEP